MGVEAAEKHLRGRMGSASEVDGASRICILGENNKAGENVHLTLDLDLQKQLRRRSDRQGAIVADPVTARS